MNIIRNLYIAFLATSLVLKILIAFEGTRNLINRQRKIKKHADSEEDNRA